MFKKKKKKVEEPVGKLEIIRVPQDPKFKGTIKAEIVITGDEETRVVSDDELED